MKCGGFGRRSLELVDHLAFGQRDATERNGKAGILGHELDLDLAEADFAGKGMVAAIAALGRIAERQQKALVAARQVLQAQIAIRREVERLARQVADGSVSIRDRRGSIRPSRPSISVTRGIAAAAASPSAGASGAKPSASCGIEQAMGVVEGRPEDLPARQILERRGDPAAHLHRAGVDRLGRAEARQRRAEGAHQEDRLDQVAARLLDGERRQFAVVERALAHDAVDGERKLLGDLGQRQFGHVAVAAPLMRQQAMGVLDGAFAALDRNIHGQPPLTSRVVRGMATMELS